MMKRYISRRVLETELSCIIKFIDEMNFGTASELAKRVLDRVSEYDLPGSYTGNKNTKREDMG